MFKDFKIAQFTQDNITINYRIGGSGPPLLLLHGYPQSHVMWHKIAPTLAESFTVIASDLRGYGDSSKPETTENHEPYSKRAMAKDQVNLMNHLGFQKFFLAGHDRGGRVSHRLALDHPDTVKKMIVMDIAPTYQMYKSTDMQFASAYFHWFLLIQPADFPERLIGADVDYFMNEKFKQWGRGKFSEEAFAEYVRCFNTDTIHGSCEDYRASATIDLEHDQFDIDANRKFTCPLLCLWGDLGFVGHKYDVIGEWKKWGDDVTGFGIECGHYLPEEAPTETVKAILDFFNSESTS